MRGLLARDGCGAGVERIRDGEGGPGPGPDLFAVAGMEIGVDPGDPAPGGPSRRVGRGSDAGRMRRDAVLRCPDCETCPPMPHAGAMGQPAARSGLDIPSLGKQGCLF